MNPVEISARRRFLLGALSGAGALVLSGCDKLARTGWFQKTLGAGESLTHAAQRWVIPRKAMAQEFSDADLSPQFRSNGTAVPRNAQYQALAMGGFAAYRLEVGGLVERPASLSLADLRALPSRTQITRHDCVEGWSAIGSWTGVRLSEFMRRVGADTASKYVWFRCAEGYTNTIDMPTALHPQTQLSFKFDDKILPRSYGFPMKCRMPTKLGFKNPKHVTAIWVQNNNAGGYWEDRGYNWFSGL